MAPFADPDLAWDFRLPRVASINASGHKYGLVYPGVGWIVWRDAKALPEDLIFWVNYLGDNMPTFALNFSRPGAQVVAQYYNFLRLGFDGYRKVQLYSRAVATRPRRPDRGDRPVRADHAGGRAAGVRVQAQGRDRELHRLRRLQLAAGARLAAAGVHLPGEPTDLAALRVVVKLGFTHDMAELLVNDIERQLPHLEAQPVPVRDASNSAGFHH